MLDTDADKTVFISYRREVSSFIARAIFMDLRANGYDVFMDVESIDNGAFDTVILNQIAARAHFVLILTPGSVERCAESGDWLRREIETAIDLKRNIVPLLVNNFAYKGHENYLMGKLSGLSRYNALNVPHDYFDEAMNKLRTRFLKQSVQGNIIPAPENQRSVVNHKIDEVVKQRAPSAEELQAEKSFIQGEYKRRMDDFDGAITDYTEAIQLNPKYAPAYYHRGLSHAKLGNHDSAVADYTQAIDLEPNYLAVYTSRAFARLELGDIDGAIQDRDKATQLDKNQSARSYLSQADYHYQAHELEKAIGYFDKAVSVDPNFEMAYMLRASARYKQGDYEGAVQDYNRLIKTNPAVGEFYNNRGEAYFALGQYREALADFKSANAHKPGDHFALAGLAITYHVLNQTAEAQRLWKLLVGSDSRFRDSEWVKNELNWADPLVNEARKMNNEMTS